MDAKMKPVIMMLLAAMPLLSRANEADDQYKALEYDLKRIAHFEKFAGETFHPQALAAKSDRDPLDIILRRTRALLDDIEKMPDAPDMKTFEARLSKLESSDGDRKEVFSEVHALRREIAFANPLLDFDKILFIKRHRSGYNHMCDQYYGAHAKAGGGVFVLEDPFGNQPTARNIVPELEGGSFLSPELSFDAKQVMFAYTECKGDPKHKVHLDHERGHWDEGRCYHLFSADLDAEGNGSNLKQLTRGTFNDFDPNGNVVWKWHDPERAGTIRGVIILK